MKKPKLLFAGVLALTLQSANAQTDLYPKHFALHEVTLTDGPFRTAQDMVSCPGGIRRSEYGRMAPC